MQLILQPHRNTEEAWDMSLVVVCFHTLLLRQNSRSKHNPGGAADTDNLWLDDRNEVVV